MEMIMRNPTEREIVRARMDALIDQRTMMRSAERRGQITVLTELVKDGILPIDEAAKRVNLETAEFAEKAGIQVKDQM